MTPAIRKLMLTAHITSSVGWLGAVAAFLVLSIEGLISHNVETIRGAYLSIDLLGRFVILPLCFGAVATGLIEALATPWGLFRYYWVVLKFGLTLLATGALLHHQFKAVSEAARRISGTGLEGLFSAELNSLKIELVRAPSLAILVLLAITALGVYKPWSLTPYGWQKLQERREIDKQMDQKTPSRVRVFVGLIGALALAFAVLHVMGHGFGKHGH